MTCTDTYIRDVETVQCGKPYAADTGLNSLLSTGPVDNKFCPVGDTRCACADSGYRPGDQYRMKVGNCSLTSGDASMGGVDGSSFRAISRLGCGPLAVLGFSRAERITHRFIRNLLKTECNNWTTLIAQHHITVGHDRLDVSIYP